MKRYTGCADASAACRFAAARQIGVALIAFLIGSTSQAASTDAAAADALFSAIEESKELVAEGLIVQGRVDPNVRIGQLETPLHRAVEKGMRGLVEALVAAGGNVRARTTSGETPLHLAALHADPWYVERLLRAGADPRARNDDGESVLYWAVLTGNLETARRLLAAGADAQIRDIKGNSTLHAAAHGGYADLIELLLPLLRDPAAANRAGLTPAELAQEAGHDEIARALRNRGTSSGLATMELDDPRHPANQPVQP